MSTFSGSTSTFYTSSAEPDKEKQVEMKLVKFVSEFVKLVEEKVFSYKSDALGVTTKVGKSAKLIGCGAKSVGKIAGEFGGVLGSLLDIIINKTAESRHHGKSIKVYEAMDTLIDLRKMLVDVGTELFKHFEYQFMQAEDDGSEIRPILIIAQVAMDRIMNYVEDCKKEDNKFKMDSSDFTKGVIFGKSKNFMLCFKKPNNSTVKDGEWSTASMFEKCGVIVLGGRANHYFQRENTSESSLKKYGYRLPFNWELNNQIDFIINQKEVNPSGKIFVKKRYDWNEDYHYIVTNLDLVKITKTVLDCINKNDPLVLTQHIAESINLIVVSNQLMHDRMDGIEGQLDDIQSQLRTRSWNASEGDQICSSGHEYKHGAVRSSEGKSNIILKNKWWPEEKFLINSFVERKVGDKLVVATLKEMMERNSNGSALVTQRSNTGGTTLTGLGGIGKTTTAVWFAVTYESDYIHVIWVDCGEGKTAESLKLLASKLSIPLRDREQELRPINFVVNELYEELRNTKCLFIFDNVDDYKSVMNVLPKATLHHTLITSRQQYWGNPSEYRKIEVLQLDVFSEEDALSFMKHGLRNDLQQNEEENASSIAEQLGYLPLALQVAVSTMNEMETKPSYYLNQLKNNQSRLLESNNLEGYGKSISDTLTITIDAISTHQDGQLGMKILNIISFLSPDNISKDLIHRLVDNCKLPNSELSFALNVLKNYSLVAVDKKKFYSIHRLLQEVVRLRIKSRECEILIEILSAMWEFEPDMYINKQHIWEVWIYAVKYKQVIDHLPEFFISILKERSMAFRHDDSMDFFNDCLPHMDQILGKKNSTALEIKFQLADCLFRLNNFEACEKIWENCRTNLHQPTHILTRLGRIFTPLGDTEIMLRKKFLQAAEFNINVVKQKKAGTVAVSDIIRVEFSESVLEQFLKNVTQLINLGKILEAWTVWNTRVTQLLINSKSWNQIAPITNVLITALIQHNQASEAAVMYYKFYCKIFSDSIIFENFPTHDLKFPLSLDVLQNFSTKFENSEDVSKAVKYFITVTMQLDEARKLENSSVECNESDMHSTPPDSSKRRFSFKGEWYIKIKLFEKFDHGVEIKWLTSINFEFVEFYKCDLISALHNCPQLEILKFNEINMIGGCKDRVYLPKLKVFAIKLVDDKLWRVLIRKHGTFLVMESISFFYKNADRKNWKFNNHSDLELNKYEIAFRSYAIHINSTDHSIELESVDDDKDAILKSANFTITKLTLRKCSVPVTSFLHHGKSIRYLTLNNVTFSSTKTRVELCDSLLKYFPQMEVLRVVGYEGTPLSLNISNVPKKLRNLQLESSELLYHNAYSAALQHNFKDNNLIPSKEAQLKSVSLWNVPLPNNEAKFQQLFGDICENVFIRAFLSDTLAIVSLLKRLVKIDSMKLICIFEFSWRFDKTENSALVKWLKQVGVSVGTLSFCLEKLQVGSNQTGNEPMWRGRKLNLHEFESLQQEIFK